MAFAPTRRNVFVWLAPNISSNKITRANEWILNQDPRSHDTVLAEALYLYTIEPLCCQSIKKKWRWSRPVNGTRPIFSGQSANTVLECDHKPDMNKHACPAPKWFLRSLEDIQKSMHTCRFAVAMATTEEEISSSKDSCRHHHHCSWR